MAPVAVLLGWVDGSYQEAPKKRSKMNPQTQFTPTGKLLNHLCQVFNCLGIKTLILRSMALVLLEEATVPWQGSLSRRH